MAPIWQGKDMKRDVKHAAGDRWQNLIGKLIYVVPSLVAGVAVGFWLDRVVGSTCSSVDGSEESSKVGSKVAKRRPLSKGISGQLKASVSGGGRESAPMDGGELKMVMVVRLDLKMGMGKVAAQCGHAAVGIYSDLISRNRPLLQRYEDCGQPKIVVSCKSQQEMNELKGRADQLGLPTCVVTDAGRTQVAAGSKTVLAIGPGPKQVIDSVTRHLKLL